MFRRIVTGLYPARSYLSMRAAWVVALVAVFLGSRAALGHYREHVRVEPGLPAGLLAVTAPVTVHTGDVFAAGGVTYHLRGLSVPPRGTRAGDCAARELVTLLSAGPLYVTPTSVRQDTLDVYAVVGDRTPVNAELVWRGVARYVPPRGAPHHLDSVLRRVGRAAVSTPCPRLASR